MQQYLDYIHTTAPMLEDVKAASKDELIVSRLRLVESIVSKKYGKHHRLYEDLVQAGNLALIRSAETYDATTGIAFASYAIPWINMMLMNYAIDNSRDMKVLTTKPLRKVFFNRHKYKDGGDAVDRDKMAKDLGVSIDDIHELEERMKMQYATMDFYNTDEDMDVQIPDYDSNPEEICMFLEYEKFVSHDMREALSVLTDRERFIIENRYFVETPMKFQDIAPVFGVSYQRIQQIEKAAFAKLKKELAEKYEAFVD